MFFRFFKRYEMKNGTKIRFIVSQSKLLTEKSESSPAFNTMMVCKTVGDGDVPCCS